MTEKMKVSELPENEQEALINEAKELNVRGVINAKTWCVDTLKAKIAEAKANQASPADDNDDKNDSGNSEEIPVPEEKKQADVNLATPPVKQEIANTAKTAKKVLICHICRSKVENGKCTGCGFEVFKQ